MYISMAWHIDEKTFELNPDYQLMEYSQMRPLIRFSLKIGILSVSRLSVCEDLERSGCGNVLFHGMIERPSYLVLNMQASESEAARGSGALPRNQALAPTPLVRKDVNPGNIVVSFFISQECPKIFME